jgi:hypothetical protein
MLKLGQEVILNKKNIKNRKPNELLNPRFVKWAKQNYDKIFIIEDILFEDDQYEYRIFYNNHQNHWDCRENVMLSTLPIKIKLLIEEIQNEIN